MCRAGPTSSRRRVSINIRTPAVHPAASECIKASQKAALHESTSATARSNDASNSSNNYSEDELCPVTGCYGNVLQDYHVYPKVLGSGHYGCVRECVQRSTKKAFAVKSIDKSKIGRLDHLRREVAFLSKMNHSGIMKMVDCYEDEEYVHIVTEKYTGGELFDKIIDKTRDDGCFSEPHAARIVKTLLEAVAYLHKMNICHRDIKPENILFENKSDDSDIRLIDFGLSRRHSKGDAPMSNPVGTAYYMSPELLKGKYDRSCDIWSVGVVAYILLCGYPPFNGDTDPDIFEAIKKGQFDFPKQAWSGISNEAKDFIKCLLRKDPKKRFTAKEALGHPWVVKACEKKEESRRRFPRFIRSRSMVQPL
ncbi:hypothetical protein ACHAXS_006905 [Conticribra weissflogii]